MIGQQVGEQKLQALPVVVVVVEQGVVAEVAVELGVVAEPH